MENLKKITLSLILVLASFAFWSCEEGEGSSSTKPKARGAIGEIVLAIDSAKWDGPVGEALREVFQSDVPGLIRGESMFDIRKIDPSAMSRIFKTSTNIIFVTTFDDKKIGSQNINAIFTKEAKEKAANDPSLYLLRSEDEFAQGQEVIYLFGNNESQLVENLLKNKNKLRNLFQVRERERMEKVLMSRKSSEARVASEKLGLEINAPASYQIVKSEDNFLWLRQPTPNTSRADISLFFYATDYTSEQQAFPDSIIALREKITKRHIFGDPNNQNSYLTIERVDPSPLFNNFLIKNNFGVEIRGGWKTNNLSMGGSFLSYVIVDSKRGKLYYMEGFVYYPNEAHREAIREIETILLATDLLGEKEKAS